MGRCLSLWPHGIYAPNREFCLQCLKGKEESLLYYKLGYNNHTVVRRILFFDLSAVLFFLVLYVGNGMGRRQTT
jgi:hypothetical protein